MKNSNSKESNKTRVYTKNFKESIPIYVVRELQANQKICSKCEGLGLYREGNFIKVCQECKSGIVTKCNYCDTYLAENLNYRHDCEGKKKARHEEWNKKDRETEQINLEKATKLTWDEGIKKFKCFYSKYYEYNEGYFFELEDFFDEWEQSDFDDQPEKPKYVWGTYETCMSFDAFSIIENATDDLHEAARDYMGTKAIDALQDILDRYAEEYRGDTTTYYQDTKYAIEIPWELYRGGK